jgi:hypothetical protein
VNGQLYHILFDADVDPASAGVRSAVAALRQRFGARRDLITSPHCYTSHYTAYVHGVMHLMAWMLTDGSTTEPLDVRHIAAQCLDMHWPVSADINLKSKGLTVAQFQVKFDRAWWLRQRAAMSLARVPCEDALDPRPLATLWQHLPDIVCLSEPPALPPLVLMLRKAWPSKTNLEQFTKKLLNIREMFEKRFTCKQDEEEDRVLIPHGLQAMRYLMQWFCVTNVGGYAHSKTIVTDWRTRALMSACWNRIGAMKDHVVKAETDALFSNPIITMFVINEFTEYALRSTPPTYAWLNAICGWQVYGDRLLEFCDAFRRCLPLPTPPDARTLDGADKKAKKKKKSGDDDDEDEFFEDLGRQITLQSCPKPVATGVFREQDYDVFVTASRANDRTKQPLRVADNIMLPPKPNVINRANPLGDRAADVMSQRTCYTGLHGFIKRGFVIGAASRIPKPFWAFLWETADLSLYLPPQLTKANAVSVRTSLNAILNATQTSVTFRPTADAREGRRRFRRTVGAPVAFEHIRSVTQVLLDHAWRFENCDLEAKYDEVEACRFIAPHLHHKYTSTSRVIALVMLFFECHYDAIALMTTLTRMYYQRFKCGSPTITAAFARLRERFPYEHAIVYGMLSGWSEREYLVTANLAVDQIEAQLSNAAAVTGRRRKHASPLAPPPSADWLLYCPNCDRVYSLVTQFAGSGRQPHRFVSDHVSGFQKPRVDTQTGDMYCSRKGDRRSVFCNETKLLHCHMRGKLVYMDGRCYTYCSRPGCLNKMERSPEDGYVAGGYACASCSLQARLTAVAVLQEIEKASQRDIKAKARKEVRDAEEKDRVERIDHVIQQHGPNAHKLIAKLNEIGALPAHLLRDRAFVQPLRAPVGTDDSLPAASGPLHRLAELNRVVRATRSLVK